MTRTERIPVGDGEHVAAVYHEGEGDRWIVFCHGFISDKSGSYEGRCRRAVREGYDAVRFDFRGCGDSDGLFVEQSLGSKLADLAAVLDHFDPSSLVLFGSSFGGKVAFHAAVSDPRVEAVATRAPVTFNRSFDERRQIVERNGAYQVAPGYEIDQRFFEEFDRYSFDDIVEGLDVPVAIFHGADDNSVPIEDSFTATERLDTDVLCQKYCDEGHRFSRQGEDRMREQLFGWLDSLH